MTAVLPATNATRADSLRDIRNRLADLADEATQVLEGTGQIRERARAWLEHIDRALGTEATTTIDDTINELADPD